MRPPISDPFGPPAPLPVVETRLFKHRFWRVYFGMIPMSAVFALWILATSPRGSSTSWLLFFLIFINPAVAAISMRFRPVKVTRLGVQGQSNVGLVEWEQMRRVRFLWLGIPYARVSVHKRPILALWIPLSLVDAQGFARAIEEWAPDDNPLRLWVRKRNF